MNIDIVCMDGNPLPAGESFGRPANTRVLDLATALAAEGHDVVVRVRKDDSQCPAQVRHGARVILDYIPAGPPRRLAEDETAPYAGQFATELSRRWAGRPPRLLHADNWTSGLAAHIARDETGVTVVQDYTHLRARPGGADEGRQARLRMMVALGSAADAVIVESSFDAERLRRLGVPRGGMYVIPRGVQFDLFWPRTETRPPSDRPRLIHVSRNLVGTDLPTAIQAMPAIPGAELVIVGGPPRNELFADPAIRELSSMAASLGVADRVRYAGRVSRPEVAALLRSSDLALSLSLDPGFGAAAVEGMACGLPVLATTQGGRGDSLLHGMTGYHVPLGHPNELARRVRALLRDDVLREAFGFAAVDRARARYAWPRIVGEIVAVYERAERLRARPIAGTQDQPAFAEAACSAI